MDLAARGDSMPGEATAGTVPHRDGASQALSRTGSRGKTAQSRRRSRAPPHLSRRQPEMPSARLLVCGALCGLLAVLFLGCDGGGSSASVQVLGTWERYKFFGGSASTDLDDIEDTWTITFRPDSTFTMSHVNERIIAYAHHVTTTSREGTYTGGADGTVQLSGGWVENAADVHTLDGLAEIYMSFTQDTTYYLLGDTGDVMFFGPDFVRDSPFYSGDSYNLLFRDEQGSFIRESNLELVDGTGAVVEKRVESYTYTLIDDLHCSVTYSFDDDVHPIDLSPTVKQGSGTSDDCEYVFPEEPASVIGLDGNPVDVSTITFTYQVDGVEAVDNFAVLAEGVLISYPENHQDTVLFDNFYKKVAD
jgi:hypothetical protein